MGHDGYLCCKRGIAKVYKLEARPGKNHRENVNLLSSTLICAHCVFTKINLSLFSKWKLRHLGEVTVKERLNDTVFTPDKEGVIKNSLFIDMGQINKIFF